MPVAGTSAVMELTALVEQFRQTLPLGEAGVDFFFALGYFRALGSSDCRTHALADYVSTSDKPPGPLMGDHSKREAK